MQTDCNPAYDVPSDTKKGSHDPPLSLEHGQTSEVNKRSYISFYEFH